VPFGFLKRHRPEADAPGDPAGSGKSPASTTAGSGASTPGALHKGSPRGVLFTALTEDWRLRGRMEIAGRLSDAINRREAIAIADVVWGSPEAGAVMEPAPGLRSVDPYDLILVTAGEDSLPPLNEAERAALKIHKIPYDVALEVPPFRVVGTVYLHPGSEPERLLDRSTEMFVPVVDAVARIGDVDISDTEDEIILVNRFYLRGVAQVDKRTGAAHPRLPGAPLGGTSWQERDD
jgi:hypothetical protein